MKNHSNKINTSLNDTIQGVLFALLFSSSLYSQSTPKKPVSESDFSLWGTMYEHTVSDNGAWVTAYMHYEESPDTLHIGQVKGKKSHKIVAPGEGRFFGEHKFAVMDQANTLQVIDLETGVYQTFLSVFSFSTAAQSKYLITVEGTSMQTNICIRNYKGELIECLEGFTEFKLDPTTNRMLCIGNVDGLKQVVLVDFGKQLRKTIIASSLNHQFSQPVWSESSSAFVFIQKLIDSQDVSVCYYSLRTQQLQMVNKATIGFPTGFTFNPHYVPLSLSSDDQRVLFELNKERIIDSRPEVVQVWNSSDAMVYSKSKKLTDFMQNTRYIAWNPEKNSFISITSDSRPFYLLSPSMDRALTYSLTENDPQYTMRPNVDYHLVNLETGEEQLLVSAQTTNDRFTSFSPNGDYFIYFKGNSWKLFDLKRLQPVPNFSTDFTDWCDQRTLDRSIYGIAGWGIANDCVYIHDRFDVWEVPFNGSKPIRITHGRDQQIVFRLIHFTNNLLANSTGNVFVDLTKDLVFSGVGEISTGYFIRKPKGTFQPIVFNDCLNNNLIKAKNASVYVYQSQNYTRPVTLESYTGSTGKKEEVYQSNKHHYDYTWGKQEQVYFTNSKNERLKAILYYPASYDSTLKYPMVVSIYEELNYLKNYYFNPSVYNGDGFNVATLTARGYFVLLPDIVYEQGNPGLSATDCVVAATKKIISMGLVAPDRIALMGHSFGGYETNFILTQTSLFKTAISGASVFDLPSWYLSVSKDSGDPEIWRFESQQWRMGRSLYEDKEGYERNSPSTWVTQVTNPLLLWTGELDKVIDPNQSIAYYLALRRLKKQPALLIYKNEDHSLLQKQSQKDLNTRINDWLSYYLKDQPPKPWMHGSI